MSNELSLILECCLAQSTSLRPCDYTVLYLITDGRNSIDDIHKRLSGHEIVLSDAAFCSALDRLCELEFIDIFDDGCIAFSKSLLEESQS